MTTDKSDEAAELVVGEDKLDEVTGNMDVDGSTMTVNDRKVQLPEKVVIVDAKLGKEIGFIEREKVMGLLQNDGRYEGFEDGCTGQFMLSYSSESRKMQTITMETDDVAKFLGVIEKNLDTAMEADESARHMLGVSYVYNGRNYVLQIAVKSMKEAMAFLSSDVSEALRANGGEESTSMTDRIIEAIRKRRVG